MPSDNQPTIPDGWEFVNHLTAVTKQSILEGASIKIKDTTSVEGGTIVTYTTRSNKTMAILSVGEMHYMIRHCD